MKSSYIRRWALLIASSTLSTAGCTPEGDPTGGEEELGEASLAVKTIVNNGGFESGDLAGFRVRGVMNSTTAAPYGPVGRLRGATGWVAQDITGKLSPGTTYTFQASVRQAGSTADQTNSPRLRVDNCDPNGTEYAGMSAAVPFTPTWQTLTAQLTYTGQGPVCIRVTANGYQGDTFVDDVSVSGGVALANPSFATGTVAGWEVPGVDAVASAPYEGIYAAEITGGVNAFVSQNVAPRLVAGVPYTFRVRAKVTSTGTGPSWSNPRLRLGSTCEVGKEYGEVAFANDTAAGWQERTLQRTFTAAELGGSVCFGVQNLGFNGVVQVDGFSVTAATELCETAVDDDGDGLVNNGCACTPGESYPCYDGSWDTEDVGSCHGGTRLCNPDGQSFGPCTGQVLPSAEVCGNQQDEDCDGQTNDGCPFVAINGAGYALRPDGTLWSVLGPTPVPVLDDVASLGTGTGALVSRSDGTVWGVGGGQIQGLPGPATALSASSDSVPHYMALVGGTVQTWGYVRLDGVPWPSATPVTVTGLSGVTAIAAGLEHSLALKSDGTVWQWGDIGVGEPYYNLPFVRYMTPQLVPGLTGVVGITGGDLLHVALKNDGTVWAWGYNDVGQLGDGTYGDPMCMGHTLPYMVPGLSGVTAVASGYRHTAALKADGTVWTWGGNWAGQLGDGTLSHRNVPTQVPGLTGVTAIAAGYMRTMALKDGAVWIWGEGAGAVPVEVPLP